jgi:hypothetical protein
VCVCVGVNDAFHFWESQTKARFMTAFVVAA